jgi:hypothetical protein
MEPPMHADSRRSEFLQRQEIAFGPTFEDMRDREPDLGRARALIGDAPRHGLDQILDDVIADGRGLWKPNAAACASDA